MHSHVQQLKETSLKKMKGKLSSDMFPTQKSLQRIAGSHISPFGLNALSTKYEFTGRNRFFCFPT